MKELQELKAGVQTTPNGLSKNLEMDNAAIAEEVESLKRAVFVAEAEAESVKKMHSDH